MFIKVTNAAKDFLHNPLYIKADAILTVYEGTSIRNEGTVDEYHEDVTFIFSPTHGTWEVLDSAEDVYTQLVQLGL
jgi:hypothetical protein